MERGEGIGVKRMRREWKGRRRRRGKVQGEDREMKRGMIQGGGEMRRVRERHEEWRVPEGGEGVMERRRGREIGRGKLGGKGDRWWDTGMILHHQGVRWRGCGGEK